MKIERKLLKNLLLDMKTYFFSKSLKNIKKRVIYAVLEKRNIVRKKNVYFGFLPPTNENKIKTLKSHFLGSIFVFIQIA